MKKLLILLFSLLISFNSYGLFEKTVCVETDAQERDGVVYLTNNTKPFTGKNLCKFENGQIKLKQKYKNGKLDGKDREWHDNGQIKRERNFKDGDWNGKWVEWDENGQKEDERNFQNGVEIYDTSISYYGNRLVEKERK